ncbi:MAG: 50S ribosomal protein L4 [Planctomycetaceae bacterium]|jgi:large subunit ribosomal protein L4|nr:50S ribosomal protein L4 [Planctomycetaceae bacterium]MBT6483752.1 50S ribosomal protein L4 [Planctomycetaceae bacterium]MBT6494552.1 50S ribosomal protein L4 [Planctomycetaceae bacterium]
MISVPVRDQSGNDVGTYEFDPAELAGSINKQLLHDVVVMYEANRRVGTVKTKSRGQVRGSTAKLYRQKGTGRARAGSARTPVRRGGGHAFAKRPLDWSYRLPKKAVRLATRMALLSKFIDGEATVLDGLKFDAPKTRAVADMLKSLGVSETTCLLAIDGYDANILRSSRNIPGIEVSSAAELNAYGLLHQKQLLVTREALDRLRGVSSADVAS